MGGGSRAILYYARRSARRAVTTVNRISDGSAFLKFRRLLSM